MAHRANTLYTYLRMVSFRHCEISEKVGRSAGMNFQHALMTSHTSGGQLSGQFIRYPLFK